MRQIFNLVIPLNIVLILGLIISLSSFKKGTQKTKTVTKTIPATIKDADSNVYKVVVIGKQIWMAENLRTTHYVTGKSIFNVKDSSRWTVFNSGAYCAYKNDPSQVKTHGLLYNWSAVNDSQKICPNGWHVPTDAEWSVLDDFLGGNSIAGGKMKDTTSLWQNAFGNTNESGFNGVPSGCRTNKGTFSSFGFYSLWWSSTENYSTYAWYRSLNYNSTELFRHYYYKRYGFSVRCLKD